MTASAELLKKQEKIKLMLKNKDQLPDSEQGSITLGTIKLTGSKHELKMIVVDKKSKGYRMNYQHIDFIRK